MENKNWTVGLFILNLVVGTILLFMGSTIKDNFQYSIQEYKDIRKEMGVIAHVAGAELQILIIDNAKEHALIRQDLYQIKDKLDIK